MKKRKFIDKDILPEFKKEYQVQKDNNKRIILNETTNNEIQIIFDDDSVNIYFMHNKTTIFNDKILNDFNITQLFNINSLIPNMKSYLNASSGRKMLAEKTTRKL